MLVKKMAVSNSKRGDKSKLKLKLSQRMFKCLRDKKCILNKGKNHMIKMHQ